MIMFSEIILAILSAASQYRPLLFLSMASAGGLDTPDLQLALLA